MSLNVRNPLLLPELAQQVASYSGYREQRDLAYTCKRLFGLVIPFIWRKVDGVKIIMRLIPGVKVIQEPIVIEHGMKGIAVKRI
ncbi:hypothetical protein FRC11_009952, partial [Ceratobasidium sp. 423]